MINSFLTHPTRIVKTVLIFVFFSLAIINIIAFFNPLRGYELSYYDSTPFIIFLLLGFCIFGGIIILFHQAYFEYFKITKVWILGFVLLIFTRIIILYLPYIRGYSYGWMGDPTTHIGIIREIINTGQVNPGNFYPILHIFLAQCQILSMTPIELIANYSTAFFSVLFVLSTYLLAKLVFSDYKPILLTLAAVGCVLFSGYDLYLMPNGWSCLYLPFVIFLILKSINSAGNPSFTILAVITIALYPFFHPLSTLILILLLALICVIFVSVPFLTKIPVLSRIFRENLGKKGPWIFLIVLGCLWSLWILSFKAFSLNIREISHSLSLDESVDVIGKMSVQVNKMNLDIFDIFTLFVKQNGDELLFILLFCVGFIILLKHPSVIKKTIDLFILGSITFFLGMLYVVYLFHVVPGMGSINAQRILYYICIVTPVFAGLSYSYLISKKKITITVICILLLIIPPVLSMLALVPSPYVYRPTQEITQMDVSGMKWTFDNKEPLTPFLYIMTPEDRFADLFMGITERNTRLDIDKSKNIPDHFNYTTNQYFGQQYTIDYYAVLTKLDTIVYDTVYSPMGRFHVNDFERFELDPTVEKIYSNRETNVYYIQSKY